MKSNAITEMNEVGFSRLNAANHSEGFIQCHVRMMRYKS
jgi:hypothetical protein